MLNNQELPSGWNEETIQTLINFYEQQSEDDALEEDQAAFENEETIMQIPSSLVPQIRQLLAKYQKSSA